MKLEFDKTRWSCPWNSYTKLGTKLCGGVKGVVECGNSGWGSRSVRVGVSKDDGGGLSVGSRGWGF